ncbi:UbiA prenyltransferase family-domain-containing protein [Hygrophoropsis aurantiaca]|uniref:UbiA prenyltransferase family-domain-containing protein n=1 Tax=Hygrophoropsis aurantiaca TaxID=72124 RepID=A0ACB8ASI3_9AGAM|nr:UbiA prenyltransferase family-domain-containing protein [Hygrophoropsis aurantiaca]
MILGRFSCTRSPIGINGTTTKTWHSSRWRDLRVARQLPLKVKNCVQCHIPIRYVSGQITPPSTWVDCLPPKTRPYLYLTRIDKPIGTLLLFYPCAWSITMASYALEAPFTTPLTYISLFGVGAMVMRGAGCTINDMWDKNLDKAVARTQSRPLARGDITRRQALVFLAGQLTTGLGVLLQLNWYRYVISYHSILLGASSLSVVTIYPLMKRITHWPQAVLGLAFNWGALLGWSAVAGAVNWSVCLPLYAGGICWTLVYDSIYAHQDKTDDVNVGIRSTALLFGEQTRPILGALSASTVSLITYAGVLNAQGASFYLGVGLGAVQLARILWRTDFDSRPSCWKGFVGCGWAGFWVWMGALGDYSLMLLGL